MPNSTRLAWPSLARLTRAIMAALSGSTAGAATTGTLNGLVGANGRSAGTAAGTVPVADPAGGETAADPGLSTDAATADSTDADAGDSTGADAGVPAGADPADSTGAFSGAAEHATAADAAITTASIRADQRRIRHPLGAVSGRLHPMTQSFVRLLNVVGIGAGCTGRPVSGPRPAAPATGSTGCAACRSSPSRTPRFCTPSPDRSRSRRAPLRN